MLKKIKKRFSYLLGAVLAFVFSKISFAESLEDFMPGYRHEETPPLYGPSVMNGFQEPTLWEKIFLTISFPIAIILILALIIGFIIYFKKKKKNAKKN